MSENQKKFMKDFHELCKKYSIDDVAIEKDMDGNPIIAFHSNGKTFYFREYVSPAPINKEAAFYNVQYRFACHCIE